MRNHVRSITELRKMLGEQVYFLQSSARAYDGGKRYEAKRLASTIRTLLHDTNASKSLLGQMDCKESIRYVDTIQRASGFQAGFLYALVFMRMTRDGLSFAPMLFGNPDINAPVDFDTWWQTEYVVIDGSHLYTRKDLVLFEANKEGGSHVDPKISERNSVLRNPVLPRTGQFGGVTFLPDVSFPSVRQIAFELLLTLRRYYPELFEEIYF